MFAACINEPTQKLAANTEYAELGTSTRKSRVKARKLQGDIPLNGFAPI